MSQADTILGNGFGVLKAVHGVSVTYAAPGGAAGSAFTAVRRNLGDSADRRFRRYHVAIADVAAPELNGEIVEDSETWYVEEIGDRVGNHWPLTVSRPQEHS